MPFGVLACVCVCIFCFVANFFVFGAFVVYRTRSWCGWVLFMLRGEVLWLECLFASVCVLRDRYVCRQLFSGRVQQLVQKIDVAEHVGRCVVQGDDDESSFMQINTSISKVYSKQTLCVG